MSSSKVLSVAEVAAIWDDVEPTCPFCPPPLENNPSSTTTITITPTANSFTSCVKFSAAHQELRRVVLPNNNKPSIREEDMGANNKSSGVSADDVPSTWARGTVSTGDSTTAIHQDPSGFSAPPKPTNVVGLSSSNESPATSESTCASSPSSVATRGGQHFDAHSGKPLSNSTFTDFPLYMSHVYSQVVADSADDTSTTNKKSVKDLPHYEQEAAALDHVLFSNTCAYSRQAHEQRVAAQFNSAHEEDRYRRQLAQYGREPISSDPNANNKNAKYLNHAAFAKVRSLVSQEKRRFQEDGFDLDLTYITRRIIAMGFPSSGRESYFRNPVDEVERFFKQRHGDGHFRIYNLCSERVYDDETRFKGQYRRFPFDDHNAPSPISLIADCCFDAVAFLQQHRDNVIAIHCKAGKGRTGLVVACLLRVMEGNKLRTADDAMKFFGDVRTADGHGVTIPSQHRYVRYWDFVLNKLSGVPPPRRPVATSTSSAGKDGGGQLLSSSNSVDVLGASVGSSGAKQQPKQFFSIHLHGIALRSHVLTSYENQPAGGSGGGGGGTGAAAGSGYAAPAPDVYFTIEENNVEVFDSRRGALVVPSTTDQASSNITNTKTTSADFFVKNYTKPLVPQPPQSAPTPKTTPSQPFTGHMFNFLTESQAEILESRLKDKWGPQGGVPTTLLPTTTATHAALRAATSTSITTPAPKHPSLHYLLLAGDVRFTFYRQSTSMLMKRTESTEICHFWVNTFIMDLMAASSSSSTPSATATASSTSSGGGKMSTSSTATDAKKSSAIPAAADGTSTTAAPTPSALRELHLTKNEMDGPHKDKKHSTYCKDIGITLFFTRDREYTGPEAKPLDRTADKALKKKLKEGGADGGAVMSSSVSGAGGGEKGGSDTDGSTSDEDRDGEGGTSNAASSGSPKVLSASTTGGPSSASPNPTTSASGKQSGTSDGKSAQPSQSTNKEGGGFFGKLFGK